MSDTFMLHRFLKETVKYHCWDDKGQNARSMNDNDLSHSIRPYHLWLQNKRIENLHLLKINRRDFQMKFTRKKVSQSR